jgi:hypothetical protein
MAAVVESEPLNAELVAELGELGSSGASLEKMVDHVQARLGFSKSFVVPVLPYFCAAFSLPLREVLPLREWITDRDDREVEGLVAKIRRFKPNTVAQTQEIE